MQQDKGKLILEIKEAFKGVILEDGVGLSEADAIDSYAETHVKAECRQNDEQHDWCAIPSSALNKYYSSLCFFDAKVMRFHLPAFMLAEINGEYCFGMSFALTHLSDYTKSQFELLSKRQRETIRLFLIYLSEEPNYEFKKPEIKRAIEGYWQNKPEM